jgi:hypothetical protein
LLAAFDRAFVGVLGLQREVAFGLAHRLVGAPDVAAALPTRRAGGEFDAARCSAVGT